MRHLLAAVALTISTVAPAAAQPTKEHLDAMRHLRLAQENMHAEHWDKAEAEFRVAIKLEPSLEMAHYGLGQVYMATKRYSPAVGAFLSCRDTFVVSNARRGLHDADVQQALNDQIEGLEDQKGSLGAGRGNVLNGGQFDIDRRIADVKAYQRRSTATSGIPAWLSVALGSAYFRSGAMADAEREYLAALTAEPKLGEGHNNLAVVFLLTGRYAEAQAEIAAAEKYGFRVNPQLKSDLRHALERT
jgi:tetratricopeptide (TPR) repeat protein